MECYLDNSATTRVSDEVAEIMMKVMKEDFGNPSSKHMKGVESERYLREARETLAGILRVSEKEIIFTSGGTESNNMALIGAAMANARRGKHIITTQIEHASVTEPLKFLEGEGFEITYLPVDGQGHISLDDLAGAIRDDTILVSTIYVNNEIGAVQDVAAIGKLIKKKDPEIIYHIDAIQAFGKYDIFPSRIGADLVSVSGHKFHGPKGIGFLYVSPKIKIRPLVLGGGQQKGRRSGTDNVPGAAGIALAASLCYEHRADNVAHMISLKDHMIDALNELGGGAVSGEGSVGKGGFSIKVNSQKGEAGAPHIVSCTFAPVKSEVLLHALEERGVYVSSGSACSSNKPGLSGTLQAIGLSKQEADQTLRFSFCETTTMEEIDYAVAALKELLPVLSKFTAR